MVRPEQSLEWYMLCRSTEFNHLPYGGCWADQPDWLIHDFRVIGERLSYLRSLQEKTRTLRDRARKRLGMSDFRR